MTNVRPDDVEWPSRRIGARRYRATHGVEQAKGGWLRKRVDCDVNLEVVKANAMRAALDATPYRAPIAQSGDLAGTMLVEDLGSLTSIAEIAEEADELTDAARHAARILATLHTRLGAAIDPSIRAQVSSARWPFGGDTFLHCDFSPMNVFRDRDGAYVTLDGSPTFTATVSPISNGRPATDLATFTVVLCWPLRPLHWRRRQLRMRLAARRTFLRTYESMTGVRVRHIILFETMLFLQSLWFRKILRRRRP